MLNKSYNKLSNSNNGINRILAIKNKNQSPNLMKMKTIKIEKININKKQPV
jgi:hypothetical protein